MAQPLTAFSITKIYLMNAWKLSVLIFRGSDSINLLPKYASNSSLLIFKDVKSSTLPCKDLPGDAKSETT